MDPETQAPAPETSPPADRATPPYLGPAVRTICDEYWAILPARLQVMLSIASRETLFVEALAAAQGAPLDNTRTVTVRSGVATIPVRGVLMPYANIFAEISGATSLEVLARDFRAAVDDPQVRAIALIVDSPGGDVAGTAEMAAMIYAARARKPVTAFISHLGASAAYWLSAAATEIVVSPTALVGGLGVIATFPDPSGDSGALEFISSQTPKKAPDLSTEDGQAQIQATVDTLATVFLSDVARYRGVSLATVETDFGQGDLRVGQDAVTAGLADRVGTEESEIARLAAGGVTPPLRSLAAHRAALVRSQARLSGHGA